jgi:hypothetical protein
MALQKYASESVLLTVTLGVLSAVWFAAVAAILYWYTFMLPSQIGFERALLFGVGVIAMLISARD